MPELQDLEIVELSKLVGINERGLRVGEDHQRAKISDKAVDLIRWLHEDFGAGYHDLADMFGLSVHTVGRICRYERRIQMAVKFRGVRKG